MFGQNGRFTRGIVNSHSDGLICGFFLEMEGVAHTSEDQGLQLWVLSRCKILLAVSLFAWCIWETFRSTRMLYCFFSVRRGNCDIFYFERKYNMSSFGFFFFLWKATFHSRVLVQTFGATICLLFYLFFSLLDVDVCCSELRWLIVFKSVDICCVHSISPSSCQKNVIAIRTNRFCFVFECRAVVCLRWRRACLNPKL